jgi:hypothetical protein
MVVRGASHEAQRIEKPGSIVGGHRVSKSDLDLLWQSNPVLVASLEPADAPRQSVQVSNAESPFRSREQSHEFCFC